MARQSFSIQEPHLKEARSPKNHLGKSHYVVITTIKLRCYLVHISKNLNLCIRATHRGLLGIIAIALRKHLEQLG